MSGHWEALSGIGSHIFIEGGCWPSWQRQIRCSAYGTVASADRSRDGAGYCEAAAPAHPLRCGAGRQAVPQVHLCHIHLPCRASLLPLPGQAACCPVPAGCWPAFAGHAPQSIPTKSRPCSPFCVQAEEACQELLEMLADHLPGEYPTLFHREGSTLVATLTGERFLLEPGESSMHPLEACARLVQVRQKEDQVRSTCSTSRRAPGHVSRSAPLFSILMGGLTCARAPDCQTSCLPDLHTAQPCRRACASCPQLPHLCHFQTSLPEAYQSDTRDLEQLVVCERGTQEGPMQLPDLMSLPSHASLPSP